MDLREVAVGAALSDIKDEARFARAEPYIKDLIASGSPRYQGLGHLFRGAIGLERSGLASGTSEAPSAAAAKLRAEALADLKVAAAQWPNSATAQLPRGAATAKLHCCWWKA